MKHHQHFLQFTTTMNNFSQWPSDSENPNFPAYLIHHTIQDQDYDKLIYKGDPLFVDRNGHNIL